MKDLDGCMQALKSGTLNNLHTLSVSLSHLSSSSSHSLQEPQNTLNLTVTTNNEFSQFLRVLRESQSSLTNIEFNLVQWELEQVKDFKLLLNVNPNLKQLAFRRNSLSDDHCLSELFSCFRTNTSVKGLVVSESRIGSYGAGVLASALKDNDALEELEIWEDSIGTDGAEELSKMIEVNSTLRLLTVFDSRSVRTATPLVSAVLARNRSVEVHFWSVDSGKKICKVVELVASTLRVYNLDVKGLCRVGCALGWNSVVGTLDLTGVMVNSKWAKEFRCILEQNRTLKLVNLSKTGLKNKGVVYVAAGLFKNESLETLYLEGNLFGGIGVEHLLCPLSLFSSFQTQANTGLKSLTIGGKRSKVGRDGVKAILLMLATNRSLTRFGIVDDESLKPDDIVCIFKSLEKNATLRCLSFQGCKGVKGDIVLQTILDTLNVNPWIQEIDLARTALHAAGKTESIYEKLGQNEANAEELELDFLKDMPMSTPTSCRVFLLGQENAGKNTLCNSISENMSPSKVPYVDQVRILVKPVEQAVKTPGMRIKSFNEDDGTKISIWNLSSQHEFYSLQDLMFPGVGSASLFLIVCSLFKNTSNREPKTAIEIEEDLNYWLRFIFFNSRQAAEQCVLPSVTLVLTHCDKIHPHSDSLRASINLIQELLDKFHGSVEFHPTVFTVDARSSTSVSTLSQHLRMTCRTMLERVPRVYQLCNDLLAMLQESKNEPTMSWEAFNELCQVKIPSLRFRRRHSDKEKVEARRGAMATCLHSMGEVIYFDEFGFIVLDCQWFYGEVLGQLTRLGLKTSKEKTGFTCRKDLEKVLMGSNVCEKVKASDLVRMMLKIELYYEQDPSDPDSPLLIPSNLEEGTWKPQRWQVNSPDCNYVGRHLQCDDSSHSFLAPGFFPRLQVHLHNKIIGLRNQYGASYSLEKYLISININGIYIRVELGGRSGHYIDVLACSSKSHTEMLRLFHQLIIPAIHNLCHGFALTEHVLRSECVKNLIPPRYRKNQCISLHHLKQALLSIPADSIYDYQHTWDSVKDSGSLILESGFDFARNLLSDDDFREVLHCRYHDLHNLAIELQVPQDNKPDEESEEITGSVEPSFAGIAKGVEAVLERLQIIEKEIRDIKQELQGLRYYEHRLLIQLHNKVNYLVNYNMQIEERKVPNMFYFVQTQNYTRRLITRVISGMNALRVHMLCEYRREMHVVEDQMGCEIMHVDNMTVKSLAPYMTKFMKLVTFALKIGAHLAAGMGELIPDLGREVAHLASSPLMYGAAGTAAAGVAGAAVLGNRSRNHTGSRDGPQDHGAAQQWLMDFLRDQRCSTGKDIAEKFGLWRVRYRDDGRIAWVCRRHMYSRANEIVELPI